MWPSGSGWKERCVVLGLVGSGTSRMLGAGSGGSAVEEKRQKDAAGSMRGTQMRFESRPDVGG
jgi:hypothetical protein